MDDGEVREEGEGVLGGDEDAELDESMDEVDALEGAGARDGGVLHPPVQGPAPLSQPLQRRHLPSSAATK